MERQRWDHAQILVRWGADAESWATVVLALYPAGAEAAVGEMSATDGPESARRMLEVAERHIATMGGEGWELVAIVTAQHERGFWLKRLAE